MASWRIAVSTQTKDPRTAAWRVTSRGTGRRAGAALDAVGIGLFAGTLIGALAGLARASSVGGTAAPIIVLLSGMLAGASVGGLLGVVAERRRPARARRRASPPAVRRRDPRLRDAAAPRLRGPGWYEDPLGEQPWRYWDGYAWTEHVWSRRPRA
jgi:hypothetical protein